MTTATHKFHKREGKVTYYPSRPSLPSKPLSPRTSRSSRALTMNSRDSPSARLLKYPTQTRKRSQLSLSLSLTTTSRLFKPTIRSSQLNSRRD